MRAWSATYSVVDPERFPPSPLPKAAPIVLVPGIFWPKKGQLEFIEAVVPRLAEHGIESRFAGDFDPAANPYAAACARAAEPHSDHVRFLGYRADLPRLYAEATSIAVPSRHEGLMRGMIEAMSCGRPVVSFDVCSAREVLEPAGAGVVVRGGDHAGMADALIGYARDSAAAAGAGAAASAVARALFDPDEVVERYERVYRALAG
jgi:glycosyltransferase involved in cell wall biosynthesis